MDTGDKLLLELGDYSYFEKLYEKELEVIDMFLFCSTDLDIVFSSTIAFLFNIVPEYAVQIVVKYQKIIKNPEIALVKFWEKLQDDDFLIYSLKYLEWKSNNVQSYRFNKELIDLSLLPYYIHYFKEIENNDVVINLPSDTIALGCKYYLENNLFKKI